MQLSSINIRQAIDADIPKILFLLLELGYELNDGDHFRKTWMQIMSSENMGIMVAETNGVISGYIAYSYKPQLRLQGLSMEIDELSVSSNYKGRGIGSALIIAVKKYAISKNVKRIILATNRERESYKRNFYLKNGFQEKDSAWLKMDI